MDIDRWEFDAFLDWSHWMLGLSFDLDGHFFEDPFGRFRVIAASIGPLIIVAAYRA